MSLPASHRNAARLQPPRNIMNVKELEQINTAATAAAAYGNNPAVLNPGNEFLLAPVSSSINLPGFWLEKPSI